MVENKLMKHVRRLFIFALLFVSTLSLVKVKADTPDSIETTNAITVSGVSIRTTGNTGIRFRCNIHESFDEDYVKKFGILIGFGVVDATTEFVKGGKANGYDILSVEVSEIDEDRNYFGTIYNIPVDSYIQNVTARSYVILNDDSIIYGRLARYCNLTEVALIASDNEVTGELITSLCNNVERVTLTEDQSYQFSRSDSLYGDGKDNWYFMANPIAVVNNNLEYNKKYVCYEYHKYDEEFDYNYDVYALYETDVTALENLSDSVSIGSSTPKEDIYDTETIFVMPGTYTGDITINKNNLYYVGVEETYYDHTETFVLDETTQAIIDGKVTITGDNVYIWGFVYKNQVDINGCNNVELANSVNYSSVGPSIKVSKASSNISIISLYKADNTDRWVYILAETENFTMADCVVLDGLTYNDSSNVDMVRFSDNSNYEFAKGIIDIEYNYFRCSQMAFCDRNPAADKYIIFNNYFEGPTKTAIQLRHTDKNDEDQEIEIVANTFVNCGNTTKDWDVIDVYTGSNTSLKMNYNVFVDSDFNDSTEMIWIYNESATLDCSNNYFWDSVNEDTDDFNATGCCNLSAATTGLSLWELDSPISVIYPLAPYQVSITYKEVDGVYKPFKYYISGLNCSYEPENEE